MTPAERQTERRYRYEERLALLDCFGTPTDAEHNMAVIEADAAIAAIERQEREEVAARLVELKMSL